MVEQFDLSINQHEHVTAITPGDAGFQIATKRHGALRTYRARRVVLAIGDMHRPRRLGIEGEDLPHVSHYFDEPHRYFRQRLLIVGGRNSAVEAALRCHRAGADVAISYRRAAFSADHVKYWLLPEIEMMVRTGRIAFYPQTRPRRITPTHVTLEPVVGGAAIDVPAHFVLLLVGYEQDAILFKQAGVALVGDNRAPRVDERTMQTNVPGLYVAGTGAAGTQAKFRLFIENCHEHVDKIVRDLTGKPPPFDCRNTTNDAFARQREQLPEA